MAAMAISILDPTKIRDISELLLDQAGRLRVLPTAELEQTTAHERALFGVRHACYVLPTQELVAYVKGLIGDRTALEIGAGNGVLADALGIPATDSHLQTRPDIALLYAALRHAVIRYGANVQKLDALAAVRAHRPQVVVGAWVTHLYDPRRHWAEGNQDGVDEEELLTLCEQYVFIGNDSVHSKKAIWEKPHTKTYLPFVFSRAQVPGRDFIAVWEGSGQLTRPC